MSRFFRRRKFCRFTAEGVKQIDYKDIETLKRKFVNTQFISFEGGHLFPFEQPEKTAELIKTLI